MTRVDEINAQIANLEVERQSAMNAENANALAKMKAAAKLYGFKKTDFKCIVLKRTKRCPNKAKDTAKKATN